MSTHLTPLEVCERLIAPIQELGPIAGMNDKAAYNWRRGSQYRDPGDMPPRVNRDMLRFARENDRPLTPDHLIWGAPLAEINALLGVCEAAE